MEPQIESSAVGNLKAYAQWASFTLEPHGFKLSIKNATLEWGKFYSDGDKNKEISPATVNETVVVSGENATIYTCGRSDASAGTEGSFEVYAGETKVGKLYWECPWGSKTNTWNWTPASANYVAQMTGGSRDSGAIGAVIIKIAKF